MDRISSKCIVWNDLKVANKELDKMWKAAAVEA
jgi:hypothetical protein